MPTPSPKASRYASPSEIGFRLRWVRENQGLTFREVSKKSGVSIGIIHRVEKGRNVELRNFLAIIEALNVQIETVLMRSGA